MPVYLYGVLEANLLHEDKNQVTGQDDPNSGGTRLFLTPGLQYVTQRFIIEAAVQWPMLEDLNGKALESDYIVHAWFRFAL
ncbi:MAG: hypothetical protein ACT4NU_08275 [Chromatiales bacterium]